ncbi:MAG TPA: flagellin [Burkholderiaceae bacterium]|nr:flagellin [Burkholderiaceae bacterium]
MLSLHTNIAALSAHVALGRAEGRTALAATRLGTGLRINSAMDDAAGLQIATRLAAQSRGMATAVNNIQKSLSLLQTAEGALDESGAMLIRMKDLATQAADASSSPADRVALQAEFAALGRELSHIASGTTFGGSKLLLGDTTAEKAAVAATAAAAATSAANAAGALATAQNTYNTAVAADLALSTPGTQAAVTAAAAAVAAATSLHTANQAAATDAQNYAVQVAAATAIDGVFSKPVRFQIGASASETMLVDLTAPLGAMHSALHAASSTYDTFGIQRSNDGTELLLASTASATIDKLQSAIDAVASTRSQLGATANRMTYVNGNLTHARFDTTVARGRIVDTDFAQESADLVSNQLLTQAGGAVLRQSNSMASMLMSLLN